MQIKHFVYVLLQQQKHLFFNWDIMREIQNHKYYRDNVKGRYLYKIKIGNFHLFC